MGQYALAALVAVGGLGTVGTFPRLMHRWTLRQLHENIARLENVLGIGKVVDLRDTEWERVTVADLDRLTDPSPAIYVWPTGLKLERRKIR